MQNKQDLTALQHLDTSLAKNERTLDQMLTLAILSANDMNVDQARRTKTLGQLQKRLTISMTPLNTVRRIDAVPIISSV